MLKRIFSLLLCFFLLIMPLQVHGQPPVYVALGDSISTGYGLSPEDVRFSTAIAQALEYEENNLAKNGATAGDILTLLQTGSADEALSQASLVTVTCGGNDLLGLLFQEILQAYNKVYGTQYTQNQLLQILGQFTDTAKAQELLECAKNAVCGNEAEGILPLTQREEFQQVLQQFELDLKAICEYIHRINPNAIICIPTQYDPYAHMLLLGEDFIAQVTAGVQALNQVIQAQAEPCGFLVADVYASFEGKTAAYSNASILPPNLDFHPSARGHDIIAETVLTLVNPQTPEETPPEETVPETQPETQPPENSKSDPPHPRPQIPWGNYILIGAILIFSLSAVLILFKKKKS